MNALGLVPALASCTYSFSVSFSKSSKRWAETRSGSVKRTNLTWPFRKILAIRCSLLRPAIMLELYVSAVGRGADL